MSDGGYVIVTCSTCATLYDGSSLVAGALAPCPKCRTFNRVPEAAAVDVSPAPVASSPAAAPASALPPSLPTPPSSPPARSSPSPVRVPATRRPATVAPPGDVALPAAGFVASPSKGPGLSCAAVLAFVAGVMSWVPGVAIIAILAGMVGRGRTRDRTKPAVRGAALARIGLWLGLCWLVIDLALAWPVVWGVQYLNRARTVNHVASMVKDGLLDGTNTNTAYYENDLHRSVGVKSITDWLSKALVHDTDMPPAKRISNYCLIDGPVGDLEGLRLYSRCPVIGGSRLLVYMDGDGRVTYEAVEEATFIGQILPLLDPASRRAGGEQDLAGGNIARALDHFWEAMYLEPDNPDAVLATRDCIMQHLTGEARRRELDVLEQRASLHFPQGADTSTNLLWSILMADNLLVADQPAAAHGGYALALALRANDPRALGGLAATLYDDTTETDDARIAWMLQYVATMPADAADRAMVERELRGKLQGRFAWTAASEARRQEVATALLAAEAALADRFPLPENEVMPVLLERLALLDSAATLTEGLSAGDVMDVEAQQQRQALSFYLLWIAAPLPAGDNLWLKPLIWRDLQRHADWREPDMAAYNMLSRLNRAMIASQVGAWPVVRDDLRALNELWVGLEIPFVVPSGEHYDLLESAQTVRSGLQVLLRAQDAEGDVLMRRGNLDATLPNGRRAVAHGRRTPPTKLAIWDDVLWIDADGPDGLTVFALRCTNATGDQPTNWSLWQSNTDERVLLRDFGATRPADGDLPGLVTTLGEPDDNDLANETQALRDVLWQARRDLGEIGALRDSAITERATAEFTIRELEHLIPLGHAISVRRLDALGASPAVDQPDGTVARAVPARDGSYTVHYYPEVDDSLIWVASQSVSAEMDAP